MKEQDKKELNCLSFRESYDLPETITDEQSKHLDDCEVCFVWKEDADSFNDVAKNLPQFDVSENLTQKILSNVKSIELSKKSKLTSFASAALVVAFAWLFFHDALESLWGIASWVVGFATLVGLKFIIADSSKNETMHPSS